MALAPLRPLPRLPVLGLGLALLCAAAGEPVSGTPGARLGWEGRREDRGAPAGDAGARLREPEEGGTGGAWDRGSGSSQAPRSPARGGPASPRASVQSRPQFPAGPTRTRKWRKFEGGMSRPVRGRPPAWSVPGLPSPRDRSRGGASRGTGVCVPHTMWGAPFHPVTSVPSYAGGRDRGRARCPGMSHSPAAAGGGG